MGKKFLCLILIACCFGFPKLSCFAQENDLQYGLINMGIGGVIGGIGAVINKEPEQRFDKTILKGFAQGVLGGYLVFESKRLVREFAQDRNYNYIWPSKLVNAAGSSIIENAAANRDFWARWHLSLGFNRLEIDTKDNFRLRYRIMPVSLYHTISLLTRAKLDVDRSMIFGTFVFFARDPMFQDDQELNGAAYPGAILLKKGLRSEKTEAHEIVHVYQNESLMGVNMFLNKPMSKLEEQHDFLRTYNRIFYTDLHILFSSGIYNLEREFSSDYDQVSFEIESSYFADQQ